MSQFIAEKNWVKIRENYAVLLLHFLAVDNFYFDEKKWLKKFSERTRENVGVLQFSAVETSISRYIEFFSAFFGKKFMKLLRFCTF